MTKVDRCNTEWTGIAEEKTECSGIAGEQRGRGTFFTQKSFPRKFCCLMF